MIEIQDKDLLNTVVANAITVAHRRCKTTQIRDAWIVAIVKAAGFLRTADLECLDYNRSRGTLTFHAATENVAASNAECETCGNRPCYHRAMARLVKRYFEGLNPTSVSGVLPQPKRFKDELIECQASGCGWKGTERQLVFPASDEPRNGVCPKCESEDIATMVLPKSRRVGNTVFMTVRDDAAVAAGRL